MAKRTALETVRALIDDVDGVAFGKVSALLDDMGWYCDRAIEEYNELEEELEDLRAELAKVEKTA